MKRVLFVVTTALALAGCGPRYASITFEVKSDPPVPVRVDSEQIELPAGIAVEILATLQSSSSLEFVDEQLELVSEDPELLDVEAVGQAREFVLVGVAAGDTCLSVRVDHEEEECIPVRVTAP